MNPTPIRLLGLLAFGALLAQAGHLLVYQLVFGAAAQTVQSEGAHAYFPVLVKTSLGLGAAAILGSLLLIGIARLLPGSQVVATSRGPSYLRLLAVLFTVQMLWFFAQETTESLVAGMPVPSGVQLLLLGSVGQLPVAALAALALKWLAVRLGAALLTLRTELAVRAGTGKPLTPLMSWPALVLAPALAETCPIAYIKRGPPAILHA